MSVPAHHGRFAKVLRAALSLALFLQAVVFSVAAGQTRQDPSSRVASAIAPAAVPPVLSITGRQRASDIRQNQPGAKAVDAFNVSPAQPVAGVPHAANAGFQPAVALPPWSGRSPPAASL